MTHSRVCPEVSLPPFQQLIDGHGRDVHRFLVATVGPVDADDCYQETWVSALRAYPRLRDSANLRGWIFTVAHRKAIDRIRSRRREAVPVGEAPERGAASTEDRDEELWVRVRELPAKQRTAIGWRFIADSAYSEISAAMGTSEEAARRNVHEGLKRLRMEYEPS